MTAPALKIVGGQLQDPAGNRVLLRGLSSQGMCMVYGNQASPGGYVPMSVSDYIKRGVSVDAQGQQWFSRAIRLCFERFPCTNPGRLPGYTLGNPYADPDTISFAPWASLISILEGETRTFNNNRYRALKLAWRADRGEAWYPGAYGLNDVFAGVNSTHLYKCVSVPATLVRPAADNWAGGPSGTSTTTPSIDAFGNGWLYIGEFGTTGATPPFSGTPVSDFSTGNLPAFPDGSVWWQLEAPDESPAQAATDFAAWKSKVMDPAVQAAIDVGLYVVITDFDFGPATHPLRGARMLAFWTLMAKSQWASHPNVLFELWNESEDIGSYAGGPGSWATQKPLIQATVDAIRAGGANNIVIATTPFYCSCVGEATASPLVGQNLGYAWHMYASEWASPSNQQQFTQALSSGQAVFITEFGDDSSPTDPANTWLKTLLAAIAAAGVQPAAMFAWAETDSWAPSLFSDDKLTIPTVDGQAVRQWLADMQNVSQPGGPVTTPPPAPVVTTATPIIDSISVPVSPGDPVIVTGHLAPPIVVVVPPPVVIPPPVVTPPPPPVVTPPPAPPAPTPEQTAAARILTQAQLDLSLAQGTVAIAQSRVADAQLIVTALG